MPESYEEIVRKWYDKLRPDFVDLLMSKYKGSKMRLEDAENIYQDIFIAIHDNLEMGRIDESKSWGSYVMRIGLNMASKKYRLIGVSGSIDESGPESGAATSSIPRKVEEKIRELSGDDDTIYKNPEAQAVLGDELTRTPEPCASLIRYHYYGGLKDAEIVEEMPRYGSAASVKVTRNRCMKELVYRVKLALYYAGIIDEKPEKESKKKEGKKKEVKKKGGNR